MKAVQFGLGRIIDVAIVNNKQDIDRLNAELPPVTRQFFSWRIDKRESQRQPEINRYARHGGVVKQLISC